VTPSGIFSEGGEPEDAEGVGDEGEEGPSAADDASAGPGGWLPPEQRNWRHPSELSSEIPARQGAPISARSGAGGARSGVRAPGRGGGSRTGLGRSVGTAWAAAVIAAAAGVMVLGGLMLTAPGGIPGASTIPLALPSSADMVGAQATERSLVALRISTPDGDTVACAIGVRGSGLVATTADALIRATSVMALTPNGHWEKASVVAIDPDSDVGLLRVPYDVPIARFVNEAGIQKGLPAWTMAMTPQLVASGPYAPRWPLAGGMVETSETTIDGGMASGMPGIVANVSLSSYVTGDVLIRQDGSVIGILDTSGKAPGESGEVFLPAELVVGVSKDLASFGKVEHGWLDIDGSDSDGSDSYKDEGPSGSQPLGALVTAVGASGAAATQLRSGDIIEAINGKRVTSMADLRSQLYLLPPGTLVRLLVHRDNSTKTVELALASSP